MPELDLVKSSLRDVVLALEDGSITSEKLIERYLAAIERDNISGLGLRAVIETAPVSKLYKVARILDQERAACKARGYLHGVPVLIKDVFDLDYEQFGLRTTGGTHALMSARPKKNAELVDTLISAGAIILGTTNLSVLSCGVGYPQPLGWSPRGGQSVSAYGRDLHVASSSTGSAIAVSAGFCAVAIGSETNASIKNAPANCAGLYAFKVTPNVLSKQGTIPISRRQDSPGPMGKSAWDLAAVLSCIKEPSDRNDYMAAVQLGSTKSVTEFDIGIVRDAHPYTKDIDPNDTGLLAECTALYEGVIGKLQPLVDPVVCPAVDELAKAHDVVGFDAEGDWAGIPDYLVTFGHFAEGVNEYLAGLDGTEIKTFDDIIQWNNEHPASLRWIKRWPMADEQEVAFHPNAIDREDRQGYLEAAAKLHHERERYGPAIEAAQSQILAWRTELLAYMKDKQIDLLVVGAGVLGMDGPAIGAATWLPVGSIPIGQLSNGAPVGLYVIAGPQCEHIILSFMASVEKILPPRPVPKMSI